MTDQPISIRAHDPERDGWLVFHDEHGAPALTIYPYGRVKIGPGLTPDEASRAFWAGLDGLGDDLWTCSACAGTQRFDGDTVPLHDGEHGRCRNSGAVRCPTCRSFPRPWEQPCPTCQHDGVIRRAEDVLISTDAWPHALDENDPILADGAMLPVSITVERMTFGGGLLSRDAMNLDPGAAIGDVLEAAARSIRGGAAPTTPGGA